MNHSAVILGGCRKQRCWVSRGAWFVWKHLIVIQHFHVRKLLSLADEELWLHVSSFKKHWLTKGNTKTSAFMLLYFKNTKFTNWLFLSTRLVNGWFLKSLVSSSYTTVKINYSLDIQSHFTCGTDVYLNCHSTKARDHLVFRCFVKFNWFLHFSHYWSC